MKLTQILYLFLLMGFLSLSTFAQELENIDMGELHCGDIIENEFRANYENHIYTINLNAGDMLDILGVPLGDKLAFRFWMQDREANPIAWTDGDGNPEDTLYSKTEKRPNLNSGVLSSSGNYIIAIPNSNWGGNNPNESTGLGVYTLYVKCTRRDGAVIEPGDNMQQELTTNSNIASPTAPSLSEFSGFGFPGLSPVDFSAGIEIPIQAGQAQTAPIGGDIVALYTYDATANQTATLSLSRVSGDISMGVSVIKRDTNEIVFVGGMPSSNNLSVELMFPSDGTYVIGLFRMNTTEKADTSGAVQVMIE